MLNVICRTVKYCRIVTSFHSASPFRNTISQETFANPFACVLGKHSLGNLCYFFPCHGSLSVLFQFSVFAFWGRIFPMGVFFFFFFFCYFHFRFALTLQKSLLKDLFKNTLKIVLHHFPQCAVCPNSMLKKQ